MQRRHFIQASGALSIPAFLSGFRVNALPTGVLGTLLNPDSDRVLVLVRLNGGNDGLNTIVPVDQYDKLANLRSNVLLPKNRLLSIEDTLALHPNMGQVQNMYQEGLINIVQSVGYPDQNRSHFRSTDIWQSASDADEVITNGWLGRYLDELHPTFPDNYPNPQHPDPIAITIGRTVSETCQGVTSNYSLTLRDPFSIKPILEGADTPLPDSKYGRELDFVRTTINQNNAYAGVVTASAEKGSNAVTYPDNKLAEQLKNVALMISGGLQTKIYVVSLGGFDTHANQVVGGDPTQGEHAELLQTLSDAIAAFQADIQAQGLQNRVLGMTFSEFGRQIRSNGSDGTDHGTAAPLIVFGNCVNAGVLGQNPEIDPNIKKNEGVPMQHDFRDIYGSILMDWFEVPEAGVKSVLYEEFTYLPIVDVCQQSTTSNRNPLRDAPEATIFPNPFYEGTTVQFSTSGENVRLTVLDAVGRSVETIVSKRLPQGAHTIRINTSRYPKGAYFFRLQIGDRFVTKRAVKVD